ncbi:MAG: hypothetical protein ACYDCO_16320 [Armatimonadota bacterium]
METAPHPKRPRRRLPRWAWALIILAVLTGGSALAFRLYYGPRVPVIAIRRLPADTRMIIFSANGVGYPAAIVRANRNVAGRLSPHAHLLDDDGVPSEEKFHNNGTTIISPNRQVAVDRDMSRDPKAAALVWRSGGRRQITVPPPSDQHWLFPTDAGGVHDGERRYYQDGRCVVTLPPGYRFLANAQCADPRFLPLAGPQCNPALQSGNLGLYDLQRKAIIPLGLSNWGDGEGIIFRHGDRFLVTHGGPIVIVPGSLPVTYKPSPRKAPATGSRWCWGEDGTAWLVSGATVSVYDWRQGTPELRALPCAVKQDARIRDLSNLWINPGTLSIHRGEAPGVAVWGDGRLVACIETHRTLPTSVARLCGKTSLTARIPLETRELVLYQDGRRAGWYRLPIDPTLKSLPDPMDYYATPPGNYGPPVVSPPKPILLALEHLAFNQNGTRLSWVVETSKGKTIYVFKVPR